MNFADSTSVLPRFEALSGQRVVLRHFGLAHVSAAYVSWLNDPEVVRYSNQRFRRHDERSCAAYLETFENSDNLFLAIEGNAEGRLVGTMTAYRNRYHGTVDVGIMVGDRAVRGRGYGLEAWIVLANWLLGEGRMRKLTCGTLACNRAMRRIAELSGMHLEATRRAQEIVDAVPQDILYYARFGLDH